MDSDLKKHLNDELELIGSEMLIRAHRLRDMDEATSSRQASEPVP